LGVGRASSCGLGVGFGLPIRFHLSAVEAHG
jgi:hypothetical protein